MVARRRMMHQRKPSDFQLSSSRSNNCKSKGYLITLVSWFLFICIFCHLSNIHDHLNKLSEYLRTCKEQNVIEWSGTRRRFKDEHSWWWLSFLPVNQPFIRIWNISTLKAALWEVLNQSKLAKVWWAQIWLTNIGVALKNICFKKGWSIFWLKNINALFIILGWSSLW